jgi:putative PEP-CTERM system TPR-repeat lipoprotein
MRSQLLLSTLALCALALGGCDLLVSPDTRVARAQKQLAAHDYRAAMIELKNALQSQSDHAQARLLLAEVSLQLADVEAADKELRRAIEAGAPAERTAPLAAQVRLAQGRADELLKMLDSGELPLPQPERSIYRGKALLMLRQPEQALEAFNAAVAADGRSRQARLGVAEAYAASGRVEEALGNLDAILADEPEASDVLLARGALRGRRGQFEEAERSLKAARQGAAEQLSLQQQATLLGALTEAQLARGDTQSARVTHGDLAALAKDAPVTLLLSARIATAERDYPKAVSELQRALGSAPDFTAARFLLGAVLLAQGNLNQAESQLSQALARAPENIEARKLLAQVQLRLERPQAAMQVLQPVPADAGDGQVDALLGLAQLKLGDETRGLDALRRSVAANPGDRGLTLELASAYLRSGAHAEALKVVRTIKHVPGEAQRERLLIAATAAAQGLEAAREQTERLVSDLGNEAGVLNLAALYFAEQRQFERSRALLERAAQADPRDTSTLINRARVEVAAGQPDVAVGWLEKALQADPASQLARMLLADLALRRNDVRRAADMLEQARRLDPAAIEPRLKLARLHLREGRNAQADEVLKELLTGSSERADVLNAVGLINLEARRYEEALARFRAASDRDAGNPVYWLNLARAQLALGHGGVAREALQKALAARPDWVPAIGALALLDLRDGREAAALERVAALRKSQPKDVAALTLDGDVQMALKRYPQAAAAFDEATQVQPGQALALKAYTARRLGKLGEVMAPLENWLKLKPDDAAIRTALADAYQQAGLPRRAIEQYEIIVSAGSAGPGALNNLAWLYHTSGDGRAEATAKRAYELSAGTAAIADTYGWILVRSGKAAEGRKLLEQAATKASGQPDIAYHYAAALAATGAPGEARKLLTSVLSGANSFASRADAQRLLDELPRT